MCIVEKYHISGNTCAFCAQNTWAMVENGRVIRMVGLDWYEGLGWYERWIGGGILLTYLTQAHIGPDPCLYRVTRAYTGIPVLIST